MHPSDMEKISQYEIKKATGWQVLKDGKVVVLAETREKAEGYVSASLKVEEMGRHVGGYDELEKELEGELT